MPNIFKEFTIPVFRRGAAQECWENALQEFWLRKKKGQAPVYWLGEIWGLSVDDRPRKKIIPVLHGWVEIDGKIADPTPFYFGKGKWRKLPTLPAQKYWLPGTEYRGIEGYVKFPDEHCPGRERSERANS